MSEKQQQLVLSIIDFLNQSIQDGTVKSDDTEGLEVASTSHPVLLKSALITFSSSVHRRGLWRRSLRRRTGQKVVRQAGVAPEHL